MIKIGDRLSSIHDLKRLLFVFLSLIVIWRVSYIDIFYLRGLQFKVALIFYHCVIWIPLFTIGSWLKRGFNHLRPLSNMGLIGSISIYSLILVCFIGYGEIDLDEIFISNIFVFFTYFHAFCWEFIPRRYERLNAVK